VDSSCSTALLRELVKKLPPHLCHQLLTRTQEGTEFLHRIYTGGSLPVPTYRFCLQYRCRECVGIDSSFLHTTSSSSGRLPYV